MTTTVRIHLGEAQENNITVKIMNTYRRSVSYSLHGAGFGAGFRQSVTYFLEPEKIPLYVPHTLATIRIYRVGDLGPSLRNYDSLKSFICCMETNHDAWKPDYHWHAETNLWTHGPLTLRLCDDAKDQFLDTLRAELELARQVINKRALHIEMTIQKQVKDL